MTDTVVIVFDPGLKTGATWGIRSDSREPEMKDSVELEMHEVVPWLRNLLLLYPNADIVVERFVINMATAKKAQAPYSLELIGAIKQVLRDYGRDPEKDIIFQAPSDAMKVFTNPALKKLGYWHVGGAGHALDAIRHFLLYNLKRGWKPTKLLN